MYPRITTWLVFVSLALCLASGCGGDNSSAVSPQTPKTYSTPEEVVTAYLACMRDANKEIVGMLSQRDKKVRKLLKEPQYYDFEVGTAIIEGDTASVPVTYLDADGKPTTGLSPYRCVLEEGSWRVSINESVSGLRPGEPSDN